MSLSSPVPTVVWDVDDVLNRFTFDWAAANGLNSRFADGVGDSPGAFAASLGVSGDEYLASIDRFRERRYPMLRPNADTMDWFSEHGARCVNVALTSTTLKAAPRVADWVLNHFGRWIHAFWVAPSARPTDPADLQRPTKGEILQRLAAPAVFVDDTPANLEAARSVCRVIRFPQPWNGGGDTADALSELSRVLDALDSAETGRWINDHGQ